VLLAPVEANGFFADWHGIREQFASACGLINALDFTLENPETCQALDLPSAQSLVLYVAIYRQLATYIRHVGTSDRGKRT
jgi:hypothetical protein